MVNKILQHCNKSLSVIPKWLALNRNGDRRIIGCFSISYKHVSHVFIRPQPYGICLNLSGCSATLNPSRKH
jgi:hypothetical protein